MNELIRVNNDTQTVSARDLHESLGIAKRFSAWFETYAQGFVEGEDYSGAYLKVHSNQFGGEKEIQDYQMSIDMAKHICLMSRTEKGKECRTYLINLEKAWNTPEQVMARALRIADRTIDGLKIENNELKLENKQLVEDTERMKPKEIFADAVSTSRSAILIGDLAKILTQNGYAIGQKRLFEKLRNEGYLMKTGSSKNMPTQRAIEMGLFEVKESTLQNPDGSVRITKTTKVAGRGQVYFINKFLKEELEWQK